MLILFTFVSFFGFISVHAQSINREKFGNIDDLDSTIQEYPSVDKLVKTKLPYWQVGWIDQNLSRECSLGRFNQRVPYRYTAHFKGKEGAAMVGGVKGTGLNLYDPLRQASKDKDYWFYRDRTAGCIVMWAFAKQSPNNVPPNMENNQSVPNQ